MTASESKIEHIRAKISGIHSTIAKMDAALPKLKGEMKGIVTAERAALASYVGALQVIVDEYSNQ